MSIARRARFAAAVLLVAGAAFQSARAADPAPSPSPSASVSPGPSPAPSAKPSPASGKRSPKSAKAAVPPALQAIEKKYAEAKTLSAKFTQVTESAVSKQKKTSNGLLMIERPDKVRLETLSPDKNLLVSDGRKFWFYTPPFDEEEPGQIVERKASDVQSRLAHALLAGSFSGEKGLRIEPLGENRFSLVPRKGTAGTVQKAEVTIDPARQLIVKVVLDHRGGNRAEISLTDIELGKPLDSRLFHFVAPPNTQKIE